MLLLLLVVVVMVEVITSMRSLHRSWSCLKDVSPL